MIYLDASAFLKLIFREQESDAMRDYLRDAPAPVSSALLTVEASRAVARVSPAADAACRRALLAVVVLPIDDEILERARDLAPTGLGSLDALHLATALSVPRHVDTMVTYDRVLAEAARTAGLGVDMPGVD